MREPADEQYLAAFQESPRPLEPSVLRPVSGALLGAVIGGAGGAALIATSDCYELECLGLVGVAVGLEAVAVPIGAHIGNRGRGNLFLDVLASVGSLAVGFGLGEVLAPRGIGDSTGAVVLTLTAQIGAVVLTERVTGRRRDQ